MIAAACFARKNAVPFLGICLGMQVAVIEFARNVAGLVNANSAEFDGTSPFKVIDFMSGQSDAVDKGGTLRLAHTPASSSQTPRCDAAMMRKKSANGTAIATSSPTNGARICSRRASS